MFNSEKNEGGHDSMLEISKRVSHRKLGLHSSCRVEIWKKKWFEAARGKFCLNVRKKIQQKDQFDNGTNYTLK